MIGTFSRRLQTRESSLIQSTKRQAGKLCNKLLTAGLLLLGGIVTAHAAGNTLQNVEFTSLAGNKAQITLTMSQPATAPLSFTIDNPARIALDFPETSNGLAERSQNIGIGMADSMTVVEAKGRTRVVVNLSDMVPYEAHADGNKVVLTIQGAGRELSEAEAIAMNTAGGSNNQLGNVDFRRGEAGEGRVIVTLSDPSIPVDMRQEGGKVVVDFYRAQLPKELERRMDVLDFATPVKTIDTYTKGENVHMVITPMGEYDYIAYQSDDQFTIEVRQLTKEEAEESKKDELGYSGERLSLNFQDIEVRSVLQLIADFTGINVVVSDTVNGSLTLRLKNVPWDQALDIILKTKGLAMRQSGNVMLVAPSEEIAAREKLELESMKQIEELEPLYSEFIQINYAKASAIVSLLKSEETSLMSDRGMATIDARTNTVLIQDTAAKLTEIRTMIAQLDVPVRQVLIESRVVVADTNFSRDLGVELTATRDYTNSSNHFVDGDFLVALPATGPTTTLSMGFGKIGSHFLDLTLTAAEAEGLTETISSPRVLTSNQKAAYIEVGTEIPYEKATSSGATSVAFKKAVLSLNVTPQITPDDRIVMDLIITNDTVGQNTDAGPSIDTNEVATQVLIDNGETLVLGGVYTEVNVDQVKRTPVLGELPVVGWLFKNTLKESDKGELLIFVTPKIVKEELRI
ncbi:MAG: type IV pilus secretin PilQ [Gammaproteobacteria bacterium]|nr:type IV pilus secretin PilQ [Gammaproteobacteria bacterium]